MNRSIIKSAIFSGHFELSSGLHSASYVQCAKLFQEPRICKQLAKELVYKLPIEFKTLPNLAVVSPAIGAILFGYEVASELGARFVFCERNKQTNELELKRGFDISKSKILVIEDVITTLKTVNEIVSIIDSSSLVGVGCLVNRSSNNEIYCLEKLSFARYEKENCPLCLEGVKIEKPGSR